MSQSRVHRYMTYEQNKWRRLKMINKNEMINGLAVESINGGYAFTKLYEVVETQFKNILSSYYIKNNLTGFSFDDSDYISAIGQYLWEAVNSYDSSKGDFMPRLVSFARNRMSMVTTKNLREKRFDKSKQTYSFEELYESAEFEIEDTTDVFNDTEKLVRDFIKKDKDGKIITVLMTITDVKTRNTAFTKLFGQYGATERKKVQRVRERLQAHLTSNGVFI